MFFKGQNCLFRSRIAICDPLLELQHMHMETNESRCSGRRRQRVKNMTHITVIIMMDTSIVLVSYFFT